jgi:hypothetical protein
MARYEYEVRYGDTPTVLDNVQSFTITRGRVQIQDPFKAGTATITGRVPSGLPAITIGTRIRIVVTNTPMESFVFNGAVSDFKINYGIVAALDTWQIECEDAFAGAGRALTTDTAGWSAGVNTLDAAVAAAAGSGVEIITGFLDTKSLVSAQSVPNTNLLNVLQQLAFTEQGRMTSNGLNVSGEPSLFFFSRDEVGAALLAVFSDGSVATAEPIVNYDSVQFVSQADSFFEEVVVQPEGLADQRAGSGRRGFSGRSYDQTTTQAQNLADYVLATLVVNNAVPQQVSCESENQVNDKAIELFSFNSAVARVQLILRGVVYNLFVEGGTMTANPDASRWTFNIVSSEAQNFFILDSADFGVLDQNRLGF